MYRVLSLAAAVFGACWLCLTPFSPAQAGILITIDKATQKMTVDVDGNTRWVWPVSTGRRGYDTPTGSFRPFRMEEDHYSKEWDEAPMPYSIFFTSEGHAIHGSYETRNLGRRASHGCVRISPANAEKLFRLVEREGVSKARVVVRGDSDAPAVSKNRAPAQEASRVQEPRNTAPDFFDARAYAPRQDYYGSDPNQSYGYARPPQAMPRYTVQRPGY